ncbi:TetR/AcrR family transcriptional regulator [Microbacterium phyllosphaerae]
MAGTTAGGVRSARTEQTRATIVAAATSEFVARGYRPTSLRNIAAAAGISHAGLLRHFATKGELLAEVVASFEERNQVRTLDRVAADEPGSLVFGGIARQNAAMPGYLALFAALTGEASAVNHPAHDLMRDRYARLLAMATDVIEEAIAHDTVSPERDASGESVRLAAAWDGLQVLEQYLPDRVEVAARLEAYEAGLVLPVGWRDIEDPESRAIAAPVPRMPELGAGSAASETGYRVGRQRRARILQDAMRLFAQEGYGDTSLRDIAARVGVSKSALQHHYPSKEELLSAVLRERDRLIESNSSYESATRAADVLRALPLGAAHNAANVPGLLEVYAVLSCEAVHADHPAHAYFEARFRDVIDHFASLFRAAQQDGDLASHRDPEFEAVWLTALWDGLQYQWLYDRDSVDVAAEMTAHLNDVIPRR